MVTVYRFYDAEGKLLYVGIANNVLQRVAQHIASKPWFSTVARATFEHHATREEATAREREVIQVEQPQFNIQRFAQVTLSASVPGELAREVRTLARRRKVTASSIVAAALRMYLSIIATHGDESEAA